eukprot:COSAG02_NODE_3859_length_6136_cov_7.707305_1_plen_107_part_00
MLTPSLVLAGSMGVRNSGARVTSMHGFSSSGVLLCGRGPLADTSNISRLGAASDNGTIDRGRDRVRQCSDAVGLDSLKGTARATSTGDVIVNRLYTRELSPERRLA